MPCVEANRLLRGCNSADGETGRPHLVSIGCRLREARGKLAVCPVLSCRPRLTAPTWSCLL